MTSLIPPHPSDGLDALRGACDAESHGPLEVCPASTQSGSPLSAASDSIQQAQRQHLELKTEPQPLWLKRSDQLFVGLLASAAFAIFVVDYSRILGWGAKPVEVLRLPDTEYQYKLDVNQATWVEWSLLDGIGEILAKRIVEDRNKNGPFRSVDDVIRVRGIGPKRLELMRPWLEYQDDGDVAERFEGGKTDR